MRPLDLDLIGIGLLVIALVLIVIEGVIAMVWSLRLARNARELSASLAAEQRSLKADVERVRASLAETQELWKPYRKALRLLRHPLTMALMQSFAARRAGIR